MTDMQTREQMLLGILADKEKPTTPPTDDEREGLAFDIAIRSLGWSSHELVESSKKLLSNGLNNSNSVMPAYMAGRFIDAYRAADAALAYLAPIRAREIAAAEARGVEMERARVVAWLPPVWFSTDYNWRQAKSAIERGEHNTGKEG